MIKLLSIEPFSTSAKNVLIFLFFNWIKMKETQELRGKKAEQNSPSPGASDSCSCAAPGGRCGVCLWCLVAASWKPGLHSWQANSASGSEMDLLQMLLTTGARERSEGCSSADRQSESLALLGHEEPLAGDEHLTMSVFPLDSGILISFSCFWKRSVSCSH